MAERRDVDARVEHCLPCQAEPAHVTRVDLPETEIDRIAGGDITTRGCRGIDGVGLALGLSCAIDVERERIAVTFGLDNRRDGLRCDIGCALRRQAQDCRRRVAHCITRPSNLKAGAAAGECNASLIISSP